MRDFNLTHIPDLTERYPEGFGGVDMYSMDMYYEDYYIDDFPSNYEVRGEKYFDADDLDEAKELQREHGGIIFKYNPEIGDYEEYKEESKKFKVGEEYEKVCWFTAGVGYYTVKAKDDESVTFRIGRHELDGDHNCEDEKFKLKYDDDGNEYVTLYTYYDEENNIRAGYDGYGNEIY